MSEYPAVGATVPPPRVVALIPARAGSKRVPNKNIRRLGPHPVLAYSIAVARASRVFDMVFVSTDSEAYATVARHYGAEVPFLRPAQFAGDLSPDIDWVEDTLVRLRELGKTFDCFSILRPTSPFRRAETIERAWDVFRQEAQVDSLRAVEKCRQHPGKMWLVDGPRMTPLLPNGPTAQPWHSSPYQSLPPVYVQNASLEIAWSRVVFEGRTIAGQHLMPFLTHGYEGFDVNDPFDWHIAERIVSEQSALLPPVPQVPYPMED